MEDVVSRRKQEIWGAIPVRDAHGFQASPAILHSHMIATYAAEAVCTFYLCDPPIWEVTDNTYIVQVYGTQ